MVNSKLFQQLGSFPSKFQVDLGLILEFHETIRVPHIVASLNIQHQVLESWSLNLSLPAFFPYAFPQLLFWQFSIIAKHHFPNRCNHELHIYVIYITYIYLIYIYMYIHIYIYKYIYIYIYIYLQIWYLSTYLAIIYHHLSSIHLSIIYIYICIYIYIYIYIYKYRWIEIFEHKIKCKP